MRIGFTGTQDGMTDKQKSKVSVLLSKTFAFASAAKVNSELHHGDCIGADAEAHDIAEDIKTHIKCLVDIHIHPAISRKRAHKKSKFIYRAKKPLLRNRDIVNLTEYIIATPKEDHEVLRSGTWSTIRYARVLKKRGLIIYPDGSTETLETQTS